jgi:hypothetical protein
MKWLSANENIKEEIDIELYQNEKLMDDIPVRQLFVPLPPNL